MSKRKEQYERGLKRLCHYLEIFFGEGIPPSRQEIEAEIESIPGLQSLQIEIHLPETPVKRSDGFFYLVGEHYERYDDILPVSVVVKILPAQQDEMKFIHQLLAMDKS